MCTATWLIRADGFELRFNRDESRRRLVARPPEASEVGGLRCLAPVDGDAGGTWLGVNELGLAVAVLNAWEDVSETELPRVSRGALVMGLLASRSAAEAAERVGASDLRAYRGFRLAVFEPGAEPIVLAWRERRLEREEPRLPLCSSSLGSEEATAVRSRVLRGMVPAGGAPTPEVLEAFHACHAPERGPWSPCMHRADARTVSSAHVVVGPLEIDFRYAPGPPCRTPWGPAQRMRRSGHASAAR